MTMLPKLTDTNQTISFSEGDGVCSAEVIATNVVVTTNAGSHNHGSSKIKLKNVVDYNWEPKFYTGQLLALHMSGKYIAYSIKAPNNVNPGTWSGMVRVVYNAEPGTDKRTLIKGMKGEVQDLSFAHIENQVVLASIDEEGNFFVHEVELIEGEIRCKLLAEVSETTGLNGLGHRVVWCPYIPDDDDDGDDDVARLLLTTHGNTASIWNMRMVEELSRKAGGSVRGEVALEAGAVRVVAEHAGHIVDGSFAPDGTALATAAADGYVMFFQVYMHNENSPHCLHKWQPHSGQPLSCLLFLDDHDNYNSDVQFWKHAVTGAKNNSEFKIWSCESWTCLQTITFAPSLGSDIGSLGIKAMLDNSARYLVVSELKSRCLYVLRFSSDGDARCTSIAEFLLPYPALSFTLRADDQLPKCDSSCSDPYHRNGSSGDLGVSPIDYDLHRDELSPDAEGAGMRCSSAVRLRLHIVQPKGLQEATLTYSPPVPEKALRMEEEEMCAPDPTECVNMTASNITSSILQQQSQQLKNLLMRSQTQPGSLLSHRPESPPNIPPPLNLMTPDAFSSPGKREEDDPPLSATPDVTGLARISHTSSNTDYIEEPEPTNNEQKFSSAGSSPSREVQEILYLSDNEFIRDSATGEEDAGSVLEELQNGGPNFPQQSYSSVDEIEKAVITLTGSETTWPQISIAQINEANQRKASSDKSSSQSLNQSLNISSTGESVNVHQEPSIKLKGHWITNEDKIKLDTLEQKIDKLTDLVSQQSHELRALRSANRDPREVVEQALLAHGARTTAVIEAALSNGWDRVAQCGEAAGRTAAQAAGVGAARVLEPFVTSLQDQLASKLCATDKLLRDNLDKLVTSKTVMDKLSAAVSTTLAEQVRGWFRDAVSIHVLPTVEKAHAHMFRQLSDTFQQGTKEFAANTEAMARMAAERGGGSAALSLKTALDRHSEALASAATPPSQQQLSAIIADVTKGVLEKEMSWWRTEARSMVTEMSRTHSPAPVAAQQSAKDRQMQVAQIQALISAGEVDSAFQLALSASDLALVMCACRAAEPARVFGPPCILRQHVLLSLVQQLAADMTHDTHLKHRYLEEAILNMDTTNLVTREHLPGVIWELKKQVSSFLSINPGHALTRQLRMLNMAADSLLKTL